MSQVYGRSEGTPFKRCASRRWLRSSFPYIEGDRRIRHVNGTNNNVLIQVVNVVEVVRAEGALKPWIRCRPWTVTMTTLKTLAP